MTSETCLTSNKVDVKGPSCAQSEKKTCFNFGIQFSRIQVWVRTLARSTMCIIVATRWAPGAFAVATRWAPGAFAAAGPGAFAAAAVAAAGAEM